MTRPAESDELRFGPWSARPDSGELVGPTGSERLEPKVMELLLLLAARPNQVFSKEEIMQRLWPGMILGDDTLARAVSKLRKSLGDDAKTPHYIETLPKRGYRFIYAESPPASQNSPAAPTPSSKNEASGDALAKVATSAGTNRGRPRPWVVALLAGVLTVSVSLGWIASRPVPSADDTEVRVLIDRANDFYFQYTRNDNEAAIELFERVIARHPEHASAYAGLANAIAQRVLRWPSEGVAQGQTFTRLGDALKSGHLRSQTAQQELLHATQLAEHAVQLAPQDAVALKALGFVKSVREDFAGALAAYEEAVALDKDAWGPMINIADLHQISGRGEQALPHLESAFAAMTRVYPKETARVRPWYAETALLIGERHRAEGRPDQAEHWYRRALEIAPFHLQASASLANLLRERGRAQEAEDLCLRLQRRVGDSAPCASGS